MISFILGSMVGGVVMLICCACMYVNKEKDKVEVVRCKDCKWVWCDSEKSQAYHCIETGWSVEPDGYCDMGERR